MAVRVGSRWDDRQGEASQTLRLSATPCFPTVACRLPTMGCAHGVVGLRLDGGGVLSGDAVATVSAP